MRINLEWLNNYVDVPVKDLPGAQLFAERIARTSVEIEAVETMRDGQSGVVVAEVLSKQPHPDSDHMFITEINDGTEKLQIVTGARNVEVGQKVLLAKVGSKLKKDDGYITLKPVKLRGIESDGMLVALQEIGFPDKVAPQKLEVGIYVFDEDAPVQPGDDGFAVLGMDDIVVETSLTPNRADMLSMAGNAQEISAMLNELVKLPETITVEANKPSKLSAEGDEQLAPKLMFQTVEQIQIASSPLWLQKRLWTAGIKPINNVVDVTNYMMLLYGQPLHAYDRSMVADDHLVVRLAKADEQLTTLDGQEQKLRADQDIVIADNQKVLALAGVMGGEASQVTINTQSIILEAGIFNPTLVRSAARRHDLHTEASARFERGVNWEATQQALAHAAQLIQELAGGELTTEPLVVADQAKEMPTITISAQQVNHALGTVFDTTTVQNYFEQLHFETTVSDDQIQVTVPLRRWDISIPADLIEEVARLYGYDNLPVTLPRDETTSGRLTREQQLMRETRRIMTGLGFNQAITYSLTEKARANSFATRDGEQTVDLDYPMTQLHESMRQSVLTGLIDVVAYNHARQLNDLAMFEIGKTFYASNNAQQRPVEVLQLGGVIAGQRSEMNWINPVREVDFYDLKGVVEAYLDQLNLAGRYQITEARQLPEAFHPGQSGQILIDDKPVGYLGRIHPNLEKAQKIEPTFAFEIDLPLVFEQAPEQVDYQKVSRFPSITRDIAILIDREVSNETIVNMLREQGGQYLTDVILFDRYAGENLPDGQQSLAYRLRFVNPTETLSDDEINQVMSAIEAHLVQELKAEIR